MQQKHLAFWFKKLIINNILIGFQIALGVTYHIAIIYDEKE